MKTPALPKTPKSSSKPSKSKPLSSKVRVVANVRPFLPPESAATSDPPVSCVSVLDSEPGSTEVVVGLRDRFTSRKEWFKLDAFFSGDDAVCEIFEKEVRGLVGEMFGGCNATVFACGASGTGKTHMMQGTDELPGLMSLSMSMVLNMCESSGSTAEISYYEVYMGKCYDLLEPKEQEIFVLDDKDGQVHLRGLSRVPVSSMSEFQQVLSSGIGRRKVARTDINDVSSRSHGVLVIAVSSTSQNGSGHVLGKMNLIDLAGNEDNGKTGNERLRLQESAKINQSLFSLSNVIHALNNNQLRVPYRESKLTRILQDSLGGNSHALMIACLNPSEYQESFYTVSLASRSRQITNCISSTQKEETPKVKVDMEAKLREWMESKVAKKSAQKVISFGSPRPSETPLSIARSTKKQNSCQSFAKVNNATGKGLASTKRNLFQLGAPVESKENIKTKPRVIAFGSPCPSRTPLSTTRSIKKQTASQSHAKVNDMTKSSHDLAKTTRNLFRLGAPVESNGKVKSTPRVIAFGSPCPSKMPLSTTRSIKKQSASQSRARVNNMTESNQDLANATSNRNLGKSVAPIDSSMEGAEEYKDYSTAVQLLDGAEVSSDQNCRNRVTSPDKDHLEKGAEEYKDFLTTTQLLDGAEDSNDENCGNRVTSPDKDHLEKDVEEYRDFFSTVQLDGAESSDDEKYDNRVTSPINGLITITNLEEYKDSFTQLEKEVYTDESWENRVASPYEDHLKASNVNGAESKDFEENMTITDQTSIAEPKASSPDELLTKENLACTPSNASLGAIQNSLRKVLSPITNNTSVQPYEMKSSLSVAPKTPKTPFNGEDMTPNMSFNPKTPKTPFHGDELQGVKTPLDKYKLQSSNLKSSLAQEYVEFLNSASKEELLKLKGIGQKRAEYILQLRETSPLESLYDLEKIGLSAKQVDSVFKKAARVIFE